MRFDSTCKCSLNEILRISLRNHGRMIGIYREKQMEPSQQIKLKSNRNEVPLVAPDSVTH